VPLVIGEQPVGSLVLVERHESVELWTLNRPESLNAFNRALLLALNEELDRIEDDSGLRCVVLAGAGGRAFSAGADLKERKLMAAEDVPAFVTLICDTFDRIARSAVPFVAAVEGFAFGGGLECALACDIRVVGPEAQLGLTETRLAIIPGAGGTQRLPRLVGLGRAKDLILTGRRVGAEEALRIGLAEWAAGPDGTLATALHVAREIAGNGPLAVQAAKAALDGGWNRPMDEALSWERECYERTLDSEDRQEALLAFAEKRMPRYRGR
jgi:enoyl-CoA hydratase/carnithine racemase